MREIFEGALAVPATDRDAYLLRACGRLSARRQVEGLLASHARGSGFLETPAVVLFGGDLGSRLEGQRLGPYDVQSRIGAGGMGEVYRARDTRLGRTVASKCCCRLPLPATHRHASVSSARRRPWPR